MSVMCSSYDVNFRYSFFSSDFSIGRKVAAGAALAIGVALAIIFGLGIAGIIPGINAQYPILGLTVGAMFFLGVGFALAGCKSKNSALELAGTYGKAWECRWNIGANW